MTAATLKKIAMITMFIDHLGAIFFPSYLSLRIIGRIAFPIFAFLLVEGSFKTSNKTKYILRIFTFALITEIFFDLAFFQGLDFGHQNILFTFTLGLLMVYSFKKINFNTKALNIYSHLLIVIIFSCLAIFFKFDYQYLGILTIFYFYLFRIKVIAKNGLVLLLIITYSITSFEFPFFSINIPIQALAIFSLFFILNYNGKKGGLNPYFVYGFYPGHLAILILINLVLR